jgi:hypothetical protein
MNFILNLNAFSWKTMKPTSVKRRTRGFAAPWRNNFSELATTPWISSRFPAALVRFAPAKCINNEPEFSLPQSGGIRVLALTHSRRIVFNDAPWLISFPLDRLADIVT